MHEESNEVYKARIALLDEKTLLEYLESGKHSTIELHEKELPPLRAHFDGLVTEAKNSLVCARQAKTDLLRLETDLMLLPRMRKIMLEDEAHRLFTTASKLGEVWRYNARHAVTKAKEAQRLHRSINQRIRMNKNFVQNLEERLAEIRADKTSPKPTRP